MGFFSELCAKSKISIPAVDSADLPAKASRVVVLTYDGRTVEGFYDGYGNVQCGDYDGGELSLREVCVAYMAENNIPKADYFEAYFASHRLVRHDHYNGESFDDLPLNENCPDQGFFYDEDTRLEILKSLVRA